MAPVALHIVWTHGLLRSIRWGVEGIVLVVVPIALVDFAFYGATVFPAYNIVYYNVLDPSTSSELYGIAPFSYYVKNLALNFNVALPFALTSIPLLLLVGVCNLPIHDDDDDHDDHDTDDVDVRSPRAHSSVATTITSTPPSSPSSPSTALASSTSTTPSSSPPASPSALSSSNASPASSSSPVSTTSSPLNAHHHDSASSRRAQQPITLGALMLGVLYLSPGFFSGR